MRKIQTVSLVGVILIVLIFVGCAHSTVKYRSNVQEDKEGLIKFYLKSSNITLCKKTATPQDRPAALDAKGKSGTPESGSGSAPADTVKTCLEAPRQEFACLKDKEKECFEEVKTIVTPKEYTKGNLYAIVPEDNLWSTTNLSVSYVGDTHLIKQIGTEVIDHRKDYIEAVGAIVGTAAVIKPLWIQAEQISLRLPVVIDVDEAFGKSMWQRLSMDNDKWWFQLRADSQNPNGTVDTKAFFDQFANKKTSSFGFSSCREAILYICYDDSQPKIAIESAPVKIHLTVIDPSRLETLKLPDKGSLSMHDLCGADLTTQASGVASAGSLVTDVMNQVTAIKKAQDQAKQSGKKSQ